MQVEAVVRGLCSDYDDLSVTSDTIEITKFRRVIAVSYYPDSDKYSVAITSEGYFAGHPSNFTGRKYGSLRAQLIFSNSMTLDQLKQCGNFLNRLMNEMSQFKITEPDSNAILLLGSASIGDSDILIQNGDRSVRLILKECTYDLSESTFAESYNSMHGVLNRLLESARKIRDVTFETTFIKEFPLSIESYHIIAKY